MDYQMEELLPIVSRLAQAYAGYESTSITYEKAQSLMESVLFCLNEYTGGNDVSGNGLVHKDISLQEQYDIGVKLLAEKVEGVRKIFNELSPRFEDFGVKRLGDSVKKGIPKFLKWYDIKFCPQNKIVDLEYPILGDYGFLAGADAIYRYIRSIRIEQNFLGAFDKGYVKSVLKRYDAGYWDMSENICSILLTNMVGHMMVKKPFYDTEFLNEDYCWLSNLFGEKPVSDMEELIKRIIKKMVGQFYENDKDMTEYLCFEAGNMAIRIDTANRYGTLNRIFVL